MVRTYGSLQNIRASAFIGPNSGRFTLVAVNTDSVARTVPLAIEGVAVPSLTPWETSASKSLESSSPNTPSPDGSFLVEFPARSITTFVGDSPGQASMYPDWAASLSPNQRAASADPDGDGLVNLATYALGYAAGQTVPASDRPAFAPVRDTSAFFTFSLPADAPTDVVFQIEKSGDLGTWNILSTKDGNGPWQGELSPVAEGVSGNRVLYRLAHPVDWRSLFLRLRFTLLASAPAT
jgi:hypothetical protein